MSVTCAVCGRKVRVTKAGTLIRHRDTNKQWCPNGGGEQVDERRAEGTHHE